MTLVTVNGTRPMLSHLPMKLVERSAEAATTFVGASFYVSPSDYPSKIEDGKAVSTYDYIAVEARGTIEFFHDRPRLLALVGTGRVHRKPASRDRRFRIDDR